MKSNLLAKNGSRGIKRIDLAYVELASSENARDINRDIVLEIIRSQQPVARADLARSSGLQPSTISAIVEQLINEKWVSEGAMARPPRGRPSTLLSLNDAMVILVADVRPNQAIVALVDLNGRFLGREAVPLVSEPARSVAKIVQSMESMRAAHSDRSFEGIGISMPGRVDPETQRLLLAPNLKWADYDIKGAIQQQMQLQVELANAANACLLSELWSGRLDGIRNAVLITVSEGIGGAILANGQIITSRSGLAGEFGHSPIDPTGPVCGCGQRGCWEVFASSTAALRYYAELDPKGRVNNIHDLLRLTEEGDPTAITAVTRQATHLGRGLRLVTAALAPEVVLITGDLTTSWARFGPIIQKEMESTMLAGTPPALGITKDGELSRLRGAAAVVLQRHSGYHTSTHLAASGKRSRRSASATK
ncbi:MAG TPA: ROK family protein [Edaphobacter sp.]|jgi:predicted NBD/HSP70 family sugar kinase|nr:ROK family protein [Edaphobacter sp.]